MFIHEIQAHAAASGCTVLLLTSGGLAKVSAEHTMVDGVLELEDQLFEFRTERSLLETYRTIPIIMMSAVGEALVRERFDGYAAFLRKPFRLAALLATVRRVLG